PEVLATTSLIRKESRSWRAGHPCRRAGRSCLSWPSRNLGDGGCKLSILALRGFELQQRGQRELLLAPCALIEDFACEHDGRSNIERDRRHRSLCPALQVRPRVKINFPSWT